MSKILIEMMIIYTYAVDAGKNVFLIDLRQVPSYATDEFEDKLTQTIKRSIYWKEVKFV